MSDTTNLRALLRKRPADPAMYSDEVIVRDDEELARKHPKARIAAMLIRFTDSDPMVWINRFTVPAARYALVELWARRQLGLGRCFALLGFDDLHAVPGLFEAPTA